MLGKDSLDYGPGRWPRLWARQVWAGDALPGDLKNQRGLKAQFGDDLPIDAHAGSSVARRHAAFGGRPVSGANVRRPHGRDHVRVRSGITGVQLLSHIPERARADQSRSGGPGGVKCSEPALPVTNAEHPGSRSTASRTGHGYLAKVRPTHALDSRVENQAVDESACKPGSVHCPKAAGDHPSRAYVAAGLMRSTRKLGRAALERFLSDLAPGGVYLAGRVTSVAGGLLHHRFTLTARRAGRRSVFCGTVPRVTPGGRYPPPCPVEPGLSSATRASPDRRGRPAGSSTVSHRLPGQPTCSASHSPATAPTIVSGTLTRPSRENSSTDGFSSCSCSTRRHSSVASEPA